MNKNNCTMNCPNLNESERITYNSNHSILCEMYLPKVKIYLDTNDTADTYIKKSVNYEIKPNIQKP
jgi:hypothetical protein